jgi:hypothetical protein
LLVLDAAASLVVYIGALSMVSRASITEMRDLAKLLVARADRSAPTPTG